MAAGSGLRLGVGVPKALVTVGDRPMYEWSLMAFRDARTVEQIVLAVPPGRQPDFSASGVMLVEGGSSRSRSVANGLAAAENEFLVVHDAARPLVSPQLIDRAVEALRESPELDAVVTAAPVTDTVKRVDENGTVVETLDRSTLRAVQTPQVFRTAALRDAIAKGDLENATDDAFLIESAGGRVAVLDSPASNIKVTVASDIDLAEHLMSSIKEISN